MAASSPSPESPSPLEFSSSLQSPHPPLDIHDPTTACHFRQLQFLLDLQSRTDQNVTYYLKVVLPKLGLPVELAAPEAKATLLVIAGGAQLSLAAVQPLPPAPEINVILKSKKQSDFSSSNLVQWVTQRVGISLENMLEQLVAEVKDFARQHSPTEVDAAYAELLGGHFSAAIKLAVSCVDWLWLLRTLFDYADLVGVLVSRYAQHSAKLARVALRAAAKLDQWQAFGWLIRTRPTSTTKALKLAAGGGQFKLVKQLLRYQPAPNPQPALVAALAGGHLELAQYLTVSTQSVLRNYHELIPIIRGNHLQCLIYGLRFFSSSLLAEYHDGFKVLIEEAVRCHRPVILKFLLRHPLTVFGQHRHAQGYLGYAFRLLLNRILPQGPDLALYLEGLGYQPEEADLRPAIASRNVGMVRYLLRHQLVQDLDSVKLAAIELNSNHVFELLSQI